MKGRLMYRWRVVNPFWQSSSINFVLGTYATKEEALEAADTWKFHEEFPDNLILCEVYCRIRDQRVDKEAA